MKFKFHKGYRGYYLLKDNKFKKPFSKLDQLLTEANLKLANKSVVFSEDKVIEIEDEFVVFVDNKNIKEKINRSNDDKEILTVYAKLGNSVPLKLIEGIRYLIDNDNKDSYLFYSVFDIIENILYSDSILRIKVKKILSYNNLELERLLERYVPKKSVLISLEKEIEQNYPTQYVYEHLPLNYKEKEMIYVLYFIIMVELLSILK